MLGIKYPIIQGGLLHIARSELAAAVSNAGGLGIITSANFRNGEELRQEILRVKELTDKPFGVNISLNPITRQTRPNAEFVDVIINEGVTVVETSGKRGPEEFVSRLHDANVKVIHKVATYRHALKGEQAGADAIEVVGFENGGNVGMEDVTTMVLVPKVAVNVKVPVIAGGGIGDARGFIAALALGAEGVLMGTRFVATVESPVHDTFKRWMIRAQENETMLVQRSIKNTHRTLKNTAALKVAELEAEGAAFEKLFPWISGEKYRNVVMEGQLDTGMAYCGQVVGLINDVPTVKEVIDSMINESLVIGERLFTMGVFGEKIRVADHEL